MLQIAAVSKSFRSREVVRQVSFAVSQSEIVGLLANGSGKTTLGRMLAGLIAATSGEIIFDNRNISTDLAAYKRRLGYAPEQAQLYNHLTRSSFSGLSEKKI